MSKIRPPLRTLLAAMMLVSLLGCSGKKGNRDEDSEATQTHGFISVEQQLATLGDPEADTTVLFGLLRLPLGVSPSRMLRLMGMGTALPDPGSCEVIDRATLPTPSLLAYERVELVDVGDLSLVATKSTKLARQAFPTVTDFISGVLYTTRYRPSSLGGGASLTLRSRGNAALAPFSVTFEQLTAPQLLTLDGTTLSEIARLHAQARTELRWEKGRAVDGIWIELRTENGKKSLSCLFEDKMGAGVIPADLLGETGEGRLTVHRVHRQSLAIPHVDRTEVYLDVRYTQPLVIY